MYCFHINIQSMFSDSRFWHYLQIASPEHQMQNIFVQIAKCICPICKIYLFKLQNEFLSIVKIICPNCKKDIMKQLAVTINWLIGKLAKKDKNLAQLLQPIAMISFFTLCKEIPKRKNNIRG